MASSFSREPIGEITATPQGGERASVVDPAGVARHADNLRSEDLERMSVFHLEIMAKVAGTEAASTNFEILRNEAKNPLSFKWIDF